MLNVSENKSSIYQADFKEKKATLIDSKGLDCRRDKFKYTYYLIKTNPDNIHA